jgi:hypothetical protein
MEFRPLKISASGFSDAEIIHINGETNISAIMVFPI